MIVYTHRIPHSCVDCLLLCKPVQASAKSTSVLRTSNSL